MGQPPIRLDIAERSGRALVAHQGAFAVLPAVAEPLAQHLLAGHLICPDGGRDIVDKTAAAPGSIVIEPVGKPSGVEGVAPSLGTAIGAQVERLGRVVYEVCWSAAKSCAPASSTCLVSFVSGLERTVSTLP